MARIGAGTRGNVHLRIAQIDCFREKKLILTQNTMAAKFANSIRLIKRSCHDNESLRCDSEIESTIETLKQAVDSVYQAGSIEEIIGIEGNCAHKYFSVFGKLFTNSADVAEFTIRTKRPPQDPVNAVLSFVYTLYTNEFASALETVGLDSYIGYCHALRSGRSSLACDLVEEARCIADRLTLTLFNLRKLGDKDFEKQETAPFISTRRDGKKLSRHGRRKNAVKWFIRI